MPTDFCSVFAHSLLFIGKLQLVLFICVLFPLNSLCGIHSLITFCNFFESNPHFLCSLGFQICIPTNWQKPAEFILVCFFIEIDNPFTIFYLRFYFIFKSDTPMMTLTKWAHHLDVIQTKMMSCAVKGHLDWFSSLKGREYDWERGM